MLPLKFPRLWLTLGWIFVALALVSCLVPSNNPVFKEVFTLNDKVEHIGGYVALTLWFTGLYPRRKYVWIATAFFIMGVCVELLQGWMAVGRECDVYDVMANTTGIVLGIVLALLVFGGWTQYVEALFTKRER